MRHAETKHQDRACQANQSRGETAQEIPPGPGCDRGLKKGAWDIPTPSVSLCAGSRETWQAIARARRERDGGCKVADDHMQESPAFDEKREGKHKRNCGGVVEGVFETTWAVRGSSAARSSATHLID